MRFEKENVVVVLLAAICTGRGVSKKSCIYVCTVEKFRCFLPLKKKKKKGKQGAQRVIYGQIGKLD